MARIVVVGAGVIGLSTAVNIQQFLPGSDVTVVAEAFTGLTSHVAAGIFRPTLELMQGVPAHTAKQWIGESWNHYDRLLSSPDASVAGVSMLSGYHLWDDGKAYTKKPMMIDQFSYHFRYLNQEELGRFPGHQYQNGCFFSTIQIEGSHYIPWLTDKFTKNGGKLAYRKIHNLWELYGGYDIVVNCTGLAASKLVKDPLLQPNRGQMFRVKAPWLRHFIYTNSDTWIVPTSESVAIGGTRQLGDSTTAVRETESDAIWARATCILPTLKHIKDKQVVVGLRPNRYPIRVEPEIMHDGNRKLQVVHNYGHGGNGVALSWGTAYNTAEIICNILKTNPVLHKAKL